MNHQHICEALKQLGIQEREAAIYIILSKKGPHTAKELSNALCIAKPQVYRALGKLKSKRIIVITTGVPAVFSAVPFENVIDLMVKAKLDEVQNTQQTTNRALLDWKDLHD